MLGVYTATKVAVETLASTWRDELRPDGIRVSILRVGRFVGSTGSAVWPAATKEEFLRVVARSGHLGFAGGRSEPESVARALIDPLDLPRDVNADLVEVRSTVL